jgi:LmbE family N-acetylglucosaminyl deacetylase
MTENAPAAELPPLEPLPEDWERALVVVAHPDDIETGSASAIARWTGQGKHIAYCLVTSGEAGIDSMDPARAKEVREAEERTSAQIVGVEAVEFLGYPDGTVEYSLDLRRDIARVIRGHRPEIVITTNFRDTWGGIMPNQADHIAAGRAVLDAARDAGNRWVFPEQGSEPWNGVKAVWAASSPESKHAVDVTDTFRTGLDSLAAHKAYLDGLGSGNFDFEEFLESMSRATGTRLGTTFAVPFEVIPLTFF